MDNVEIWHRPARGLSTFFAPDFPRNTGVKQLIAERSRSYDQMSRAADQPIRPTGPFFESIHQAQVPFGETPAASATDCPFPTVVAQHGVDRSFGCRELWGGRGPQRVHRRRSRWAEAECVPQAGERTDFNGPAGRLLQYAWQSEFCNLNDSSTLARIVQRRAPFSVLLVRPVRRSFARGHAACVRRRCS